MQSAAAGAVFSIVPGSVLGLNGQTPPSNRLQLAGVGVGGVGFGQLQGCERAGFDIGVLCDVDDVYARKAFERWPQARRYRDFREMLATEADKIDAVYCGTPDHTHALITLAALKKKKHVCCVKPLTRTVHESRTVVRAALAAGVATQVTASPNTSEEACRTCELIWAGAIGSVREVHTWSNRPLWPQGMTRPPGEDAAPNTFDWKLWLGPAPMRPFKDQWPEGHYATSQIKASLGRNAPYRAVYHPWNFRGWWDFGTGALGDMGCHHINTPFRALKLKYPTRIEASATAVFEETAPLAAVVTYDFPARDTLPAVRLKWYDGGLKPSCPRELAEAGLRAEGTLYVGDAGVMLGSRVFPAARAKQFADVPKTLPRRSGTWGEWMESCKGGEKAGCHFEWAGLLTEFVILGNLAIRSGETINWDGAKGESLNATKASRLLNEPYHNGWNLEEI